VREAKKERQQRAQGRIEVLKSALESGLTLTASQKDWLEHRWCAEAVRQRRNFETNRDRTSQWLATIVVANVLVSALSTANVTNLGGRWSTIVPASILVLSLFAAIAGAWRSARAYAARFELYAKYSTELETEGWLLHQAAGPYAAIEGAESRWTHFVDFVEGRITTFTTSYTQIIVRPVP
jgi:hypothetical protein